MVCKWSDLVGGMLVLLPYYVTRLTLSLPPVVIVTAKAASTEFYNQYTLCVLEREREGGGGGGGHSNDRGVGGVL